MLKNYIKIACKVLMRREVYTFISLVGIVSTMAILIVTATILDNMFGQSIRETKRSRTLTVYSVMMHRRLGSGAAMLPPGYDLLEHMLNFKSLPHIEYATYYSAYTPVKFFRRGGSLTLNLRRADGQYWEVFDFDFIEGRGYSDLESLNAHLLAVINRSTRQKIFGNGTAEGKIIEVIGRKFKVIGVVEDSPRYYPMQRGDIWIPFAVRDSDAWLYDGILGVNHGSVLVKNRSDIPLVKKEFKTRIANAKPLGYGIRYIESGLNTRFEEMCCWLDWSAEDGYGEGATGYYLALIISSMLCFMLLPTINLVNINVSRILERSSEIGVRKAFGASSRALVGQFLVENIILTLVGGAMGLILSAGVLHMINVSGWIPDAGFHISYRSFFYGILMILVFGLISGVYPAWKMSRLHPVEAIRGGSK